MFDKFPNIWSDLSGRIFKPLPSRCEVEVLCDQNKLHDIIVAKRATHAMDLSLKLMHHGLHWKDPRMLLTLFSRIENDELGT